MRDQDPSAPTTRPGSSPQVRLAVGVVAVVLTAALVAFGLRMGSGWAQRKARDHMSRHEFTPAQRWLAWSAWLAPGDYASDLLQAACYRQLKQTAAWEKSLEEATRKRAPQAPVMAEMTLGQLRRGGTYSAKQDVQAEMESFSGAGVSESDLVTTLVFRALAIRDAGSAEALIEGMPPGFANEAHREYLWGLYLRREDAAAAELRLTNAIHAQPTHELARAELADLLEQRCELDRALREYADWGALCRESVTARLGVARVLRKLGRMDQSRAVLARFASDPDPAPPIQVELAEIALESGQEEVAERRFVEVLREDTTDPAILLPAARAFLLRNRPLDAQRLCTKVLDWERGFNRISELRTRVGADPGNVAAAKELQQELARLNQPSAAQSAGPRRGPPPRVAKDAGDPLAAAAAELFRLHCSACHGVRGDGQGIAAGLVFPRPRDLRSGMCRLVSTLNGVPTREDIQRVLAQGMPGAAMQSFQDLPEADRDLLAEEVLRLRREGVRQQVIRALVEEGEEVEEAEVRQAVDRSTAPGEPVRPGVIWRAPGVSPGVQKPGGLRPRLAGSEAAAKGKTAYLALGCNKCHGDDGTGSADASLFDDQGEPSRPRDLVHEPFKGGHEPAAIYARIVAGMPGSAHPAVSGLPQEELIDLVDYVRSLAREPQQKLGNHERRTLAAGNSYLEWLREASTPK